MKDIRKNIEGAIGDAFRALPPEMLELIASEVEYGGETMPTLEAMQRGYCPKSEDGQHCDAWWDCEPCHWCGFDGGGEHDCDCPRHNPELERVQGK